MGMLVIITNQWKNVNKHEKKKKREKYIEFKMKGASEVFKMKTLL